MKDEEGRIEVDGHRVWYRRVGEGGVPLLLLHGGPGAGHDYLEPLAGLAESRAVIFYDQLGCGRSDQPDDPSLWRRSLRSESGRTGAYEATSERPAVAERRANPWGVQSLTSSATSP